MRPITGLELANAWDAVDAAMADDDRIAEAVALRDLQRVADECVREAVSDARTRGMSWQTIADALGMTRQGAAQAFAGRARARRGERTAR